MTCLEKYMQEHPDKNPDDVIKDYCPDTFGISIMDEPDWCDLGSCADKDDDFCIRCWNREVPGTEPTVKPDPKTEQMMSDFLENGLGVAHILDSGERRQFDTGAVRDIQEGKGRCDLMPLDIIGEITGDPVITRIADFVVTGDRGYLKMALDEFRGDDPFKDIPTMLLEVAKHFEDGAKKYGENNWQKGIPVRCYIDSAVRHYLKYLRNDPDEPHDRAFCWNIICGIWTCKHKPELNDYAMKTCPVCSEPLPREAKFCDNCKVSMGDPDDLMGEYEEENE